MTLKRIYQYAFVDKDPVLMAMPYRKLIGFTMMMLGALYAAVGIWELTR